MSWRRRDGEDITANQAAKPETTVQDGISTFSKRETTGYLANQDMSPAVLQQHQMCLFFWHKVFLAAMRETTVQDGIFPGMKPQKQGNFQLCVATEPDYFWRDVAVVCSRKPGIFKPSQRPVSAWNHWMLFTSHQDIFQLLVATKPDMFDEMYG